ncbi:MAG: protease complex subunit PrcB family protein [Crocinitomicaceae bacterium]|nr:protease complex subunit PrcB family protein [Crocinitomicaceae bacterium]
MWKLMGLILGFFLVVSCADSKKALECSEADDQKTETMLFEVVANGILSGAGEEGIEESNVVIQSQEAWDRLLFKMDAVNTESNFFVKKAVDLTESTVIACFDQVQSSGGYSLKIADVQEGENQIQVAIKKTSPNGIATSVMTQPYYIIIIPKTSKEIIFY